MPRDDKIVVRVKPAIYSHLQTHLTRRLLIMQKPSALPCGQLSWDFLPLEVARHAIRIACAERSLDRLTLALVSREWASEVRKVIFSRMELMTPGKAAKVLEHTEAEAKGELAMPFCSLVRDLALGWSKTLLAVRRNVEFEHAVASMWDAACNILIKGKLREQMLRKEIELRKLDQALNDYPREVHTFVCLYFLYSADVEFYRFTR